eukprot:jgi/Undpi1/8316/HiC_scaffold_25.g10785.m1
MMTGITDKQVSEVLREDVRSAKLDDLDCAPERKQVASGTIGSIDGVHCEGSTSSARPAAAAVASSAEEQDEVISSSKRIKTADSSVASALARSPPLDTLPPVRETPYSPTAAAAAATTAMWRGRAPSPAASIASSSNFSAATTTASSSRASSSRPSLSSSRSCTYSRRGNQHARGSSPRPHSQIGGSGAGFFPPPPLLWGRGGVRVGGSDAWRRRVAGRRERSLGRERERESGSERRREWREKECRRWPRKDYASEAGVARDGGSFSSGGGGGRGGRSCGKKRSRSCSRERGSRATRSPCETKCSRCMEWCRVSRERKPISRTLPMDYWVRTKACKEAKSKHIEYIDNATYSREQFIEETVFTCPSTGAQRDIVLERNMFPYDVPTDVEHWTLWSREDLSDERMQEFVQNWAVSNHPHAVEWECDNNEGDRSINWFHVHVFFRIGCEDRTGLPRDPASVYNSPCRKSPSEGGSEGGMTDGEESAATDGE